MEWKENFKEDKEIVLSTSSLNGKPNANIVISLGFVDDKLLIADCMMKTTVENLIENGMICVIGGYFRIKGSASVLDKGKYFDLSKEILLKQDESLVMKNVIVVDVKEVFDMENNRVIL